MFFLSLLQVLLRAAGCPAQAPPCGARQDAELRLQRCGQRLLGHGGSVGRMWSSYRKPYSQNYPLRSIILIGNPYIKYYH